jgi:hypothetical protein
MLTNATVREDLFYASYVEQAVEKEARSIKTTPPIEFTRMIVQKKPTQLWHRNVGNHSPKGTLLARVIAPTCTVVFDWVTPFNYFKK